jgi:hypothetical protein
MTSILLTVNIIALAIVAFKLNRRCAEAERRIAIIAKTGDEDSRQAILALRNLDARLRQAEQAMQAKGMLLRQVKGPKKA